MATAGNGRFALLHGSILNSSIWVKESKETRLVWITLLAMKDAEGVVKSSRVGLADRAKVSMEECDEALKVLTSPDPDDTSGVEEGRRLREIRGGWQVVNNDLYKYSTEERRLYWAEQKRKERDRKYRRLHGSATRAEVNYIKAVENGDIDPMTGFPYPPMPEESSPS